MIGTIVKREFLDNLLSFKFIACVVVAILLSTVSAVFLTNDYKARLKDYQTGVALNEENLKHVPVYSYLAPRIYKRPNPLSIFVSGIERETGTYADINHRDIPASLRGGLIKNEFSHMFSFFDLSSIVTIIFTLLAILLSYNAITGEKEDGMLSLALANAVPRYRLLLGKYLGILTTLAVPLTLLFLMGSLTVLLVGGIEIKGSFFSTMTLLYGLSLLYLSSIALIGLFVSARTRKSSTSLLLLLSFFLIAVFLLPLAVNGYADRQMSLKTRTFEANLTNVTDEREKAIEQSLEKIPPPRTWPPMLVTPRPPGTMLFRRINSPEYIEFYKTLYPIREKVMEDYAVKIDHLREIDDVAAAKIRRLRDTVGSAFPPTNFAAAADLTAETGEDHLLRFLGRLKAYWQSYVRYLDERDAFGLRYFYPYPEEFTAREKDLIERIEKDYVKGKELRGYRGKYFEEALAVNPEIVNLDLGGLPVFAAPDRSFIEKAAAALPNILILVLYNLIFLWLAHVSFNRYDPRKDA